MRYALSRVAYYTHQGLRSERAREASQPFPQRCEHCGVSLAFFPAGEEDQAPQQLLPLTASQIPPGTISIQAARRFFEALFPQTGFEKWRVEIDSTAGCGRIEQGLRCLFLQDRSSSLKEIKQFLAHELAGHAARCIAGEHSLPGLLGVHTKNSLETEEGLAMSYEIQEAK